MAFTTGLISTVDLGTWDYYIFSDSNALKHALDGLALWFIANSGMLQGAALLGSLIMLTIFLFGAAVHKPSIGVGSFGFWMFFLIMIGSTGTARVTNMYTGAVSTTAYVPAIVLIPASIFSQGAYKAFQSMETTFAPTGSLQNMSVSQNGFLAPLDLLLSLRQPKMLSVLPWMTASLSQVVQDCTVAPAGTPAPPIPISESKDMLTWLKTYGSSVGLTTVYKEEDYANRESTVMGCGLAWDWLITEYTKMASGNYPLFNRALNEETKAVKKSGLWQASDISTAWGMLSSGAIGVNQTATEFSMNALVATNIKFNLDCLGQVTLVTSQEVCSASSAAIADGRERSKTEGAMAGSSFLKTMFTSIGFLQALFFMLFPVIALYALIVVQNTAKVVGGYIFFGIWCQSWLLIIVPIQSYMQYSIIEDMGKIAGGTGGLTLGNSAALYDMLTTKVGLAGDLMASSQMLSLALLTGSIYAVSGMAQKWAGAQHNDVSMVQNKAVDAAPLSKMSPMSEQQVVVGKYGAFSEVQTSSGAGSVNMVQSVGSTASVTSSAGVTKTVQNSRIKSLIGAISQSTGLTFSESDIATISDAMGAQLAANGNIDANIISTMIKASGLGKAGSAPSNANGGANGGDNGGATSGGGGKDGTGASVDAKVGTQMDSRETFGSERKASTNSDRSIQQNQSSIEAVIRGKVEAFNESSSQLSTESINASKNLSQYSKSLMENASDNELNALHARYTGRVNDKRHTDEQRLETDALANDIMQGYSLSGKRGEMVRDIAKLHFQSAFLDKVNPIDTKKDLEKKNARETARDDSAVLNLIRGDGSAALQAGERTLDNAYKINLQAIQNGSSLDTLKESNPEAFEQLYSMQKDLGLGIAGAGAVGNLISLFSVPSKVVGALTPKPASPKAPGNTPAQQSQVPVDPTVAAAREKIATVRKATQLDPLLTPPPNP